jgi:hypothetical protein
LTDDLRVGKLKIDNIKMPYTFPEFGMTLHTIVDLMASQVDLFDGHTVSCKATFRMDVLTPAQDDTMSYIYTHRREITGDLYRTFNIAQYGRENGKPMIHLEHRHDDPDEGQHIYSIYIEVRITPHVLRYCLCIFNMFTTFLNVRVICILTYGDLNQDDGDRPLATVKYTKIRYATLEADTDMDYITHITRDIGAS